ncbi:MAG TPA: HAMP domain-containing sensor histidine kinase [Planctomycetota bacterium]|nr:HAMP domain-containing sensor histidine kinase [Planctomycetota bacterium]
MPTLGSRIFFSTVLLSLAALAIAWFGIDSGLDSFARRSNETRLQDARRSLDATLGMKSQVQMSYARAIADRNEVRTILAVTRNERAAASTTRIMEGLTKGSGCDLLALFDADGNFVAASSDVAPREINLQGDAITEPLRNASEVARITGRLALLTRQTIHASNGPLGSIIYTEFVDRDFVTELSTAVGADMTVISDGQVAWRAGTISNVELSAEDKALIVALCDEDCAHRVRIADFEAFALAKAVGRKDRFVLSQSTTALFELYATLKGWLLPAAIVVILATLLVSRLISKRLAAPITALSHAADEVASGHLEASVPSDANTAELARLQDAFAEMTARIRVLLDDVQSKNAVLAAQRDELARANRAKSNFLATASHELRTPISSIKSFSEILLGGGADDEPEETRSEFLGIIRSESERLARLVEQLLDLARIESGVASWRNEDVDLGRLASKTLRALEGYAQASCVHLSLATGDVELPYLGDPDRLQQTLTNLVGNAIKFSPKGSTVQVSIRRDSFGFLILVDDEGSGVPEAERGRIFEKFVQSDDVLTDKPQGSGLGLAIVREIVVVHGGRVRCETAPSGGARFVVRLPAPHSLRPLDRYVAEAAEAAATRPSDELVEVDCT